MPKKSKGELFHGVTPPQTANNPVFTCDDLALIKVVVGGDRPQTVAGMVILSNYLKRKWSIVATTTTTLPSEKVIVIYTLYKPITP